MYFITPEPQAIASALEAWKWIGIEGKKPFLVTAFADVFFEAHDGIWFLDTLEGKLKSICRTKDELKSLLEPDEAKDHYLLAAFVDRAEREGLRPKSGECYDFRLHPVVGGAIDYSNIETRGFLLVLHIRGQLHDQARFMKPGTRIARFVTAEEPPARPWWKFWK